MKRIAIRYRTKPESADENQRLIEEVFRELTEKAPSGVKYAALRLDESVFLHLLAVEDSVNDSVASLDAFGAFRNGILERCLEEPAQAIVQVIGDFEMFGK